MKTSKKDIIKAMVNFSLLYPNYSIGTLMYSVMVASGLERKHLFQMSDENFLKAIHTAIINETDEAYQMEEEFKQWVNNK